MTHSEMPLQTRPVWLLAEPAFYEAEQVCRPWSEQLLSWGDDFHALLLGDALRMRAYYQAIHEVVTHGSVVVDLGTGTGVLARWALEAGAERVYGIERDPVLLERAVSALPSDLRSRFVPVPGLSFDVELPERAELIISEILGNLVDNEDCTRIIDDAVRRFLIPAGRLLPRRVERYLVPVEATRAHCSVASRRSTNGAGSPFDAYYDVIVPLTTHLAAPRVDRTFRFDGDALTYEHRLAFSVQRPGRFCGFKGWFVAELSPTVVLDISGDDIHPRPERRTASDSWKHAYLPIADPIEVTTHDRVVLRFSRQRPAPAHNSAGSPFAQTYHWEGEVLRDNDTIARFGQHS